ncbi:hypothetical protein [Sedimentitalea todarodis]|uniref:Arginine transporter n=1 Tax=Sedimentitalea todarodis TaxID=1631240 RepID=A0ABU3VCV2_9RHOB|nr:hypothetical protein [Sedimentitalea todarodis]MDU9004009.1 hypothetical protein [Sedimentitalea todarodis]
MKHALAALLCAGTVLWAAPAPVMAASGIIERACRSSGRSSATPQLCGCIQSVANSSLSRSERKKAAKLFKDPHMAQEIRQSGRRSDETFWKNYRAFGERARKSCG